MNNEWAAAEVPRRWKCKPAAASPAPCCRKEYNRRVKEVVESSWGDDGDDEEDEEDDDS